MVNRKSDKKIIDRIRRLAEDRKEIISLPPEQIVDRIINAPQPAALVQSFPEEDLYLLIQDIGPQDALPVLSLASEKQWEYLLDIDIWHKDRINMKTLTAWLSLLNKADSKRWLKWMVDNKTELLEYYLFHNIEVKLREHDQDPSEYGDDFFTYDNIFYIRLHGYPPEDHHAMKQEVDIHGESYQKFLEPLIRNLAAFDHIVYQKILLETANVIPAETEEEAYRQRNVRLAEKGFLPFEEAIRIYQPLKPTDLKVQRVKSFQTKSSPPLLVPVPQFSTRMLEKDTLFARALSCITKAPDLEHLQIEFATLSNQIITADQRSIKDRSELGKVVRKACGYVSIGLQRLVEESQPSAKIRKNFCAAMLKKYPLADIFRVGYGQALALKWRAEKWLAKSWFAAQGLSLTFWGEEWLGVLGGILLRKPLFFDNYRSGTIYREFFSIDDIKETRKALRDIIALDDLLSLMNIKLTSPPSYGFLTFKKLILTLWSRNEIGLSDDLRPLTLDQFKQFYDHLWESGKKPYKIPLTLRESFLDWLGQKTARGTHEISEKLGQVFESLFGEIEKEYGEVSSTDLDPRYIHLFLVKKNQ
ncbi:MAG: DUF6178 family protein [Desulfobacterales bacterium]